MNLNPFLTEVFNAYMATYKPLDERVRIEAELKEAQELCAKLEAELAKHNVTGDDIQKFLINAEELLGGHASEAVLTNMLLARFGGEQEKPKRKPRKKTNEQSGEAEEAGEQGEQEVQAAEAQPAASEVTKEEKQLLVSVMTREPMSVTEVAAATSQHTGDEWLPSDVSPILKALIKDGTVLTEGERRAKRYMLAEISA